MVAIVRDSDPDSSTRAKTNDAIADRLVEAADLLETKDVNPFRVRAYRRAAETIRNANRSVASVLESDGISTLTDWPGIGKSIAHAIELLYTTGDWPLLNQLRGDHREITVLTTVPGVGPKLAARIHRDIGIETLADLEAAAYDGRLATLPGIGRKRLRSVRESLAGRFQRGGRLHSQPETEFAQPPIEDLLSIDEEYRHKADLGQLVQIAPSRFNPARSPWRPVLHARRNGQKYTALYSNSQLANELGTTHDWVVIFRESGLPGQWTVVTDRRGKPEGRRIVRGREAECAAYYERLAKSELPFD